jgi:hypothetical protein
VTLSYPNSSRCQLESATLTLPVRPMPVPEANCWIKALGNPKESM